MDLREPCARVLTAWVGYFQSISNIYAYDSRFDVDDGVQECSIVLLNLLDEIDPTDPHFERELKLRVQRRLSTLYRNVFQSRHDPRCEESMPINICDYYRNPFDICAVRDLETFIESQLTTMQRLVWREIVSPSPKLEAAMSRYVVRRGGAPDMVPLSVFSEVTGLSERQCRFALNKIRRLARSSMIAEGYAA